MVKERWFKSSYRRNLVDMHIEDWDESFLSRFDPGEYADLMELAGVDAAMIYANSHVGYCYWPTKVGRMHRGLKGRDILGETIRRCHEKGMSVIVYYSVLYNNWAAYSHPDWQLVDREGRRLKGRYGVCCPNSPYRDFAAAEVREICQSYDFEGIFFDMTFWRVVCYCEHCRHRYKEETGKEIPRVVDWDDPDWVRFQEARRNWLAEFAGFMTHTVKECNDKITVEHQTASLTNGWQRGFSLELSEQSDYLGGDFYRGRLEQSFVLKLLSNLSNERPIEFHTSVAPSLKDHTTRKSEDLMEAQASLALAHSAAFLFIDAIDPVGTLDRRVYEMMGRIFRRTRSYEALLGGRRLEDVAIYYSFESLVDLENPQRVIDTPHLRAALGAAKCLLDEHIPFGVITRKNLGRLGSYKAILVPDAPMLQPAEVEALKEYVRAGGCLYASRRSAGPLAGLLGVEPAGYETDEELTYIAPQGDGSRLFPRDVSPAYPLCVRARQSIARTTGGVVEATITLPYTAPSDSKFASIHSDPPGRPTSYPALVSRRVGRGRTIWCAAALEAEDAEPARKALTLTLGDLCPQGFSCELDAHKSVEMTVFHQPEKSRYVVHLVSFQAELPNIPVRDLHCRLRLPGDNVERVALAPEGIDVPFEKDCNGIRFTLPELRTYAALTVDYS